MRLIDADELEKLIQQYNTDDKTDKALYNFAHNIINYCPTVEAYTW